ncbi:MAG: hypothetical protein Q9218_007625 [Villophora microphyllina]
MDSTSTNLSSEKSHAFDPERTVAQLTDIKSRPSGIPTKRGVSSIKEMLGRYKNISVLMRKYKADWRTEVSFIEDLLKEKEAKLVWWRKIYPKDMLRIETIDEFHCIRCGLIDSGKLG